MQTQPDGTGNFAEKWENQGCHKLRADTEDRKGVVNCSMSISQDSKIFPSSASEQRGREDNPASSLENSALGFPQIPASAKPGW